jgi:hypothetical protein
MADDRTATQSPLGALGVVAIVLMIVMVGAPFLLPVAAPQATCDLFAPLLCAGGKRPTCSLVASGGRRGGKNVGVKCPDGSGSAAPIYITAVAVSLLSLAVGLTFIVVRARRRRREALAARGGMWIRVGPFNRR